jgi:hypothetical protein
LADEWKIAKSALVCTRCNCALNVVEKLYFSVLLQQPEGLLRRDFCEECFKQNRPESVYYFWKTAFRNEDEKNKRRQPVVDIDFVLDFFKRLEENASNSGAIEGTGEAAIQTQIPQRLAFRYILALMLTRKKILVQDVRRKNAQDQDVQVFREKRGGAEHEVIEPDLNPDEISAVSTELGILLGLKAPSAPASVVAAADAETKVEISTESTASTETTENSANSETGIPSA